MKKIISQLSTNILLGCLMIFAAFYQTHFNLGIKANAESEITANELEKPSNEDLLPDIDDSSVPPEPPVSSFQFDTKLIIKAINPGYTVDGTRDVGEFVELQNVDPDTSLSLAGYSLHYVNSSGKSTALIDFSEGSTMVGEFLLLRLARTENSELAEATYTTTLAMSNARLELYYNDTIVDQVCWSKELECVEVFNSKTPTVLVRDTTNGEFVHLESYETHFMPDAPTLILPEIDESPEPPASSSDITSPSQDNENTNLAPKCQGLEFSEVLSYYSDNQSEQFIELYNPTDSTIDLTGCSLRYKKKDYTLSGEIISDGYFVFYPSKAEPSFSLTKNPSSSNTVELIDTNNSVVDVLIYIHGQKKSTSYAKFYETDGSEIWSLTYLPTPRSTNVYQEFRTCEAGKIINPLTGNCIKATTSTSTMTECPEGKYRNPLTGRCKNIESSSTEPKPCAEGYERNPETNRCRKIKTTNDGADYALVPATYSDQKTFTAFGVVLAIICAGATYIILQFRREIARMLRKVRQRLHDIRKNFLAGHISLHRNKKP